MSLECVVNRLYIQQDFCVCLLVGPEHFWLFYYPGCSKTFTNWPLLKPPVSIIHWCSLTICGAVSIKYTHMNSASADVFVSRF